METLGEWRRDPWCQYLPALHRQLAAPDLESGLPRSFVSLDFEQTCAWWETLRYLFRTLLGWRCLPAGLAWWYETGLVDHHDPRLRQVLDRWNTRNELDYFAAREWKTGGIAGSVMEEQHWTVKDYEPEPGWWRQFDQKPPLSRHGPYHGGSNPLHLSHSDPVGLSNPTARLQGSYDSATRRAVLVAEGFGSWRTELERFGAGLPHLGNRSWHVEVFDRQIGYLGKFRRSRVTGFWFQGRHSVHMAGNLEET